jgi:hypothetical protein
MGQGMESGRLAKTYFLAGRATRITRNTASAVVTGPVRAVAWAGHSVVSLAGLLNPLNWWSRTNGHQLRNSSPARPPVAAARPSARMRTLDAPVPAGTPAPKAPPPRAVQAQEPPPPVVRADAPSPEVTSAEVSGAQFIGAREKLVFARALEDMSSREEAVRARAVRSVAGIRNKLVARALCARLARDTSADVRKECVKALTALGMEEGLPAVERALSDASPAVRLAAVRSVYSLAKRVPSGGAGRGAASLVRLLSDKHEDVRRRAAACLGWLGQEHLAAHLLPLLRDESAFVRRTALDALGNLESRRAVPEVIELLNDPETSVRKRAFEALNTITGRQLAEAFPEDEQENQLLIARWRVWLEREPYRRES